MTDYDPRDQIDEERLLFGGPPPAPRYMVVYRVDPVVGIDGIRRFEIHFGRVGTVTRDTILLDEDQASNLRQWLGDAIGNRCEICGDEPTSHFNRDGLHWHLCAEHAESHGHDGEPCADCRAWITWDERRSTWLHPAPLCWLASQGGYLVEGEDDG